MKRAKVPKGKKPEVNRRSIEKKLKKKKKTKSGKIPNFVPLGNNLLLAERKEEKKAKKAKKDTEKGGDEQSESLLVSAAPVAEQLQFFLHHFQSANGFKLSPLELEAYKGQFFPSVYYLLGSNNNLEGIFSLHGNCCSVRGSIGVVNI